MGYLTDPFTAVNDAVYETLIPLVPELKVLPQFDANQTTSKCLVMQQVTGTMFGEANGETVSSTEKGVRTSISIQFDVYYDDPVGCRTNAAQAFYGIWKNQQTLLTTKGIRVRYASRIMDLPVDEIGSRGFRKTFTFTFDVTMTAKI